MLLMGKSSINGECSIGIVLVSDSTRNFRGIGWVFICFSCFAYHLSWSSYMGTGSYHTMKVGLLKSGHHSSCCRYKQFQNSRLHLIQPLIMAHVASKDRMIPHVQVLVLNLLAAKLCAFSKPKVAKKGTRLRLHNVIMY